MSTTIVQMTKNELTELLSNVVEQKISELLGDLDYNLIMKENFRKRLVRQKNDVKLGERGEEFSVVKKKAWIIKLVFTSYFKINHKRT